MKPRIMFVNAINPEAEMEVCLPPLGLGYLAAALREEFGKESMKIRIINKSIEQEIKDFKPDIIGMTSVSQNYGRAMNYAKIAKNHSIPVIMGGTHISLLPYTLTDDMDVAVIGEGEQTITDIFDFFEREGSFDKNKLDKIDGIAFKKDGKLIQTKKRNFIEPLDKLPFPARDLFEIGMETNMFSSRGCPYRCVFCASSRFWNKVRLFSAEYVVNEIKDLIENYKVRHITFYDDFFLVDKDRVRQIYELLKREDVLGRVTFSCSSRTDFIDDDMVGLLKKMNFKRISLGFESGSSRVLKYLKVDTTTVDDNNNAANIIAKHGITCYGTFVIGSPDETREEILDTLNFIKGSKIDDFDVFILIPLPGTPIWEYAKNRGLVSEDMDWETLGINFADNCQKAVILSEKLTREKLYELYLKFREVKKKKRFGYVIKEGMNKPWKIPKFLNKKINQIFQR